MPNVRQAGRYLFVQVAGPIGYAQGAVTAQAGPLAGAMITTSSLPIIAISRLGGVYVAVSQAGAQALTARDIARNDSGVAAATIVAGAVVPRAVDHLTRGAQREQRKHEEQRVAQREEHAVQGEQGPARRAL